MAVVRLRSQARAHTADGSQVRRSFSLFNRLPGPGGHGRRSSFGILKKKWTGAGRYRE
jgi:hypothetical protein